MVKKNSLVKLVSMLVKASGKSQTEIANEAGIAVPQLSRFLNGHSDLNLGHFIELLNLLDVDLNEIIKKKVKKSSDLEDLNLANMDDCLLYLFKNLDPIGKQTYLMNLAWANKVSVRGKKIPHQVEAILKTEVNLI